MGKAGCTRVPGGGKSGYLKTLPASACHLMDRFSKSLYVAGGDAGNGNPAIFGGIHGTLGKVNIRNPQVHRDDAYLPLAYSFDPGSTPYRQTYQSVM